MGPDVVRRLEQDTRNLGPGLTYLRAIIGSFFGHKPEGITAEAEIGKIYVGKVEQLVYLVSPTAGATDGAGDGAAQKVERLVRGGHPLGGGGLVARALPADGR